MRGTGRIRQRSVVFYSVVKIGFLGKDLKKVREQAIRIPGGSEFQAEVTA